MNSIGMAVILAPWLGFAHCANIKHGLFTTIVRSERLQLHSGELEAHRKTDVKALLANDQDGLVSPRRQDFADEGIRYTRDLPEIL